MSNPSDGQIKIFAGSASKVFVDKMCKYLETEPGKSYTHIFTEGIILMFFPCSMPSASWVIMFEILAFLVSKLYLTSSIV